VQAYCLNNLGTSLEELKEWVIKRIEWRQQQTQEDGAGIKPRNIENSITRVNGCKTKNDLLTLMENQSDAMHRVIDENQSDARPFDIDMQHYDYDYCADPDDHTEDSFSIY